jgi:xylitol oxidase
MQPTFQVKQVVYENLSISQLEHNLDTIIGSGYSVSLFTDWQKHRISQVWIKSRLDPLMPSRPRLRFRPSSTEPQPPNKNSTRSPATTPRRAPSRWASPAPGTSACPTSK